MDDNPAPLDDPEIVTEDLLLPSHSSSSSSSSDVIVYTRQSTSSEWLTRRRTALQDREEKEASSVADQTSAGSYAHTFSISWEGFVTASELALWWYEVEQQGYSAYFYCYQAGWGRWRHHERLEIEFPPKDTNRNDIKQDEWITRTVAHIERTRNHFFWERKAFGVVMLAAIAFCVFFVWLGIAFGQHSRG